MNLKRMMSVAARRLNGVRPLRHRYLVAARLLRTHARLPETGNTPAQIRLAGKDTRQLNRFFHTPGLYVAVGPQCHL